jgi:hypothetical protein
MNTSIGNPKEVNIYENRVYGIKAIENKDDNAYVEYDNSRRDREDSWWLLCLACFMCR